MVPHGKNTGTGLTTTLGSCTEAICNPTISTADNRFTSTGYDYDANGNLIEDAEGKRFSYDAENHQTEFFLASNGTSTPDATYHYDGDGRRVKKITDTETTVFVYTASGQLVAEYSTQTAQTPQVSYLTTDHLGSPRVITDQDGNVTNRKDYTAFGEENFTPERDPLLGYSGGDEIRKGYTGYEKDEESGLDFAQARYYNSVHGRYTSVDPLTASASIRNPQTFNRYTYVLNSPYKFTDPLGLVEECRTCSASELTTQSIDEYRAQEEERRKKEDEERRRRRALRRQQSAPPPPPPTPTAEQNAGPPQIKIERVALVARTLKRDADGNPITDNNGNPVFEEQTLAVGEAADFGADAQLNLNSAESLMNSGQVVYLRVDLAIVEGPDRSTFESNVTATHGPIARDGKQEANTETVITSGGKRMSVYYGLTAFPDGMRQGKIGILSLRVRASYMDQYDSTTNRILQLKTVPRNVRISLVNVTKPLFSNKPF